MVEKQKHYYTNDQLQVHSGHNNHKLHGEYKSYYKDGQLWYHCFYKDDKLHGEYKFYYEDGALCQHTVFVENKNLWITPTTLSNEDKLALALKYDIEFLDD